MTIGDFFTRIRGRGRLDVTDMLSYLYLLLGTILMFGPVLWLVMSSFKTPAALVEFPPSFLPYTQNTIEVEGYDKPLPLFEVTLENGVTKTMAQVRRIGLEAQMIDPAVPDEIVKVPIDQREENRSIQLAWGNYVEPLKRFNFLTYLRNSVPPHRRPSPTPPESAP